MPVQPKRSISKVSTIAERLCKSLGLRRAVLQHLQHTAQAIAGSGQRAGGHTAAMAQREADFSKLNGRIAVV